MDSRKYLLSKSTILCLKQKDGMKLKQQQQQQKSAK